MSDPTDKVNEDGDLDADWGDAMAEQGGAESQAFDMDELIDENPINTNSNHTPSDAKLDVILDIPVTLSMEVGRTDIAIRNLLQLNQGSVVELDRLAGEPLDVLVNGTLIAHGEVVVVNEKFGIRLTDVMSPSERIKKLQ
ncbi:MAG: flagellar motor switch protein FliN [Gammaproteobacteria bacterium CG22_combo_CG10-13_8_21_14_all_40_8]|nr:MAG: flagellar motor switch protein FliN [Gammaproteobacteria bacterium CG22_combo_CG10-13_8_21_14_all_40_8]